MSQVRSRIRGLAGAIEQLSLSEEQRVTQSLGQLFFIWLGMRLLTILWAALASALRPVTAQENAIPLWPPSAPVGVWLERALLAPWERWDVEYYLNIVVRGYRPDDGTAQFHPLLPWSAAPLAWVTGQPILALQVVSSVACVALLLAFERLASLDLDPDGARTGTLLMLLSPFAFVFFVPYTEGLFLLCAVFCFYWARKRSWWLAGLAGALATLARQQGLFLVLPLLWELWEVSGRDVQRALGAWRDWLAVTLIPAGMLVWLVFRAVALGDLQANLSSLQSLIYSVIISPSASEVVPYQAFVWPWRGLWLALTKLWNAPEPDLIIDLFFAAYFVTLLVIAWRHIRSSYRIYTVAVVVASFSYHTGAVYPYMGLPRHLMLAFPVFIGLGAVIRSSWQRLLMTGFGLLGFFFLLLLYGIEGWIP
jgi:hypothetical protein